MFTLSSGSAGDGAGGERLDVPGDLGSINGKSLCRDGCYTGVLILCLRLLQTCRELMSQRDIEPLYHYTDISQQN